MSTTKRTIDPEVVEILREVVADPEAHRLLVDRLEHFDPTSLFEPISSRSVELSVLERELVSVHREEVAWLLRQAWRRIVHRDPVEARKLAPYVTADRPVKLVGTAELSGRVRRVAEFEGGEEAVEAGVRLLEDHIADSVGQVGRKTLVLASLHLAPSDEARITLAWDLSQEGNEREARRLLETVWGGHATAQNRSFAWDNTGWSHAGEGDVRRAMRAYRRSSLECENRPGPMAAWLQFACLLGDRSEAIEAANLLDETVQEDHPILGWRNGLFRSYRDSDAWNPEWAPYKTARRVIDSVGSASRKVLHELT